MSLADTIQVLDETYITNATGSYSGTTATAAKELIVNETVGKFDNVFDDIFNNTTSASDSYKSALFYSSRNADFKRLQDSVSALTTSDKENVTADIENARRQSQINEWSAYNKLDTLFVSQLTFIALVFLAPLLYLKTLYIIPSGVFWGVALLIFLIILFTIIARIQYTDKSRSNRFWHRRRFGDYSKTPNTVCV